MAYKHNIFQHLHVDECKDDDHRNSNKDKELRMAIKKLNEIENLKKKDTLNQQEKEKITREAYYRNIVEPKADVLNSFENTSKKHKERLKKKEIQRQKEERQREEIQRQKEEQQRDEKQKQEERERLRQEHERNKRLQSFMNKDPKLIKEFYSILLSNNNDVNKTYKILSLKYHPDKNKNKDKILSNEKQTLLNNVRDCLTAK
jgi:hypothetical protein